MTRSPQGDFDSHREAALKENVAFLAEQGFSDKQIADRLGIKADTLQNKMRKWRK